MNSGIIWLMTINFAFPATSGNVSTIARGYISAEFKNEGECVMSMGHLWDKLRSQGFYITSGICSKLK